MIESHRATYVKNDVAEDDDEESETPEEISEEKAGELEAAATTSWDALREGGGVCQVPMCGGGEAEGPIEVGRSGSLS